ncbi:MAG: hypothetical protein OEX81_02265 [Candidatus Pacebacteria bacterium]|nr:hypothetical protein [Candidatus Paceibacterota bacterium]
MARSQEIDNKGIVDNEPKVHFYWDDDFLGIKPSEGKLGMLDGRETILKEDLDYNPIVLYADNMEVCVVQTAAFYALRAGYSNIGDFLLHNLETEAVKGFLQDAMVRKVLKAEFDFISYNMRVMADENNDLHQESFENYQREERMRVNLFYAAGLLAFAEQRSDAIYKEYLRLRKEVVGNDVDDQPSMKARTFEDNNGFGSWLYPKDGETIH